MRTSVFVVCTIVLFALAGCSHAPETANGLLDLPVACWDEIDPGALNARVDSAAEAGSEWARSATLVVLHSLGGDAGARSVELSSVGNAGERPDSVVVHLARDGFLDDSVRGDRHRAVVRRGADGTWRFHSVQRAFRCWRGETLDDYDCGLCP